MLLDVHAAAYKELMITIQKDNITDHKEMWSLILRERYICELKQQKQPNKIVARTNLRQDLTDEMIALYHLYSYLKWIGRVASYFVFFFSWRLLLAKAVASSYLLASKDHLKAMVTYLWESILMAFQNSKEMTLPPTLDDFK